MSSLPLKYAKKAGIKNRIAHAHSTSQDRNIKLILKKFYMTKIPKYATQLFACGEDAGKWMFSGHDFEIIKNSIDFNNFKYNTTLAEEVRNELNIKKDELVIGHVGRFCYPKNHHFLVDVFKEIHDIVPNSTLVLVGQGELENEIKNKVVQNNLKNSVKFLGLRTDIHRILNAMDCFVFPSNYEGFPVSIVEAQASGLLCFISDRVPQECIISDQVKVVSLDESANQWAKQILSSQSNYKRNNKEIKDSGFDINENSTILMKLYEEMMK